MQGHAHSNLGQVPLTGWRPLREMTEGHARELQMEGLADRESSPARGEKIVHAAGLPLREGEREMKGETMW